MYPQIIFINLKRTFRKEAFLPFIAETIKTLIKQETKPKIKPKAVMPPANDY